MAKGYKPAYRKTKAATSVSVKIIIALLVVLVITLAAFLIKVIVKDALDPGIVYPPETTDDYSLPPQTDAPEVTTEKVDNSVEVRAVEASKFEKGCGTLLLVNKNNPYTYGAPRELVSLFDERHDNFTLATASEQLSTEAYEALARMTDAYAERNGYCPLMITSGYRDEAKQKEYYDNYVVNESDKAYVELPGYSDHHTGLCFDVKLYDKDGVSYSYATEKAAWIVENYKNYGFIMRYPANKGSFTGIEGETNHFRYVGLPHSVYIADKVICLEEYLNTVRSYTYESPLYIPIEHDEYYVWYCTGDTVYVPREGEYTVSDDNTGGFVVTVKQ